MGDGARKKVTDNSYCEASIVQWVKLAPVMPASYMSSGLSPSCSNANAVPC